MVIAVTARAASAKASVRIISFLMVCPISNLRWVQSADALLCGSLIRMRSDRHDRHASGEGESQREHYRYLLHDRAPSSVCLTCQNQQAASVTAITFWSFLAPGPRAYPWRARCPKLSCVWAKLSRGTLSSRADLQYAEGLEELRSPHKCLRCALV